MVGGVVTHLTLAEDAATNHFTGVRLCEKFLVLGAIEYCIYLTCQELRNQQSP